MNHSIASLITLARASHYHDANKVAFKRAALSFLRGIVKELCLTKESYSVRFNAGGIAVSGDAILHHDKFYLHVNDFGGYWRRCKGQRDFHGGSNNNFNTGACGKDISRLELIDWIRAECFGGSLGVHGTQAGAGSRPWEAGHLFDALPDAYHAAKQNESVSNAV